jgi:hypothetical protein
MTETQVLNALRKLGPQIEKVEAKRTELYELQNKLVVQGGELNLSAAAMARARTDDGEIKYIAEFYRQILRRNRPDQGKGKAS